MKNQNAAKSFAFKLAQKQAVAAKAAPQWKARDGVALAGCSGPDARGDRYPRGYDQGIYC